MPATAGRVRMPANNRVHSSAALQTHGIWQSAIGYDPYAPTNKEDKKDSSQPKISGSEPDAENAYANFQGLLALARVTGSNNDVDRGACKKCGRVGHLKFQCKNLVKIRDELEKKDQESVLLPMLSGLDKLKGNASKVNGKNMKDISEASDEEDDSESSDSDEDPEIERILSERYGKKLSAKKVPSRKKRESDEYGSDTDSGKRGRSKGQRNRKEIDASDDSGERRRKRRKEKRRKRSESSSEDDERRRKHWKSRKERRRRRRRRSCQSEGSDSERSEDYGRRHRHKSRRRVSSSDSDSCGADDPRTSRNHKRSEGRKSRRRHVDN